MPMIHFRHGLRTQIDEELAANAGKSIHPAKLDIPAIPYAAPAAAAATGSAPAPVAAGQPVSSSSTMTMVGGRPLKVTRISGEVFGNPFGRPSSLAFDEVAMAMINLGGAMPDAPKPPADAKKPAKK